MVNYHIFDQVKGRLNWVQKVETLGLVVLPSKTREAGNSEQKQSYNEILHDLAPSKTVMAYFPLEHKELT